MVVVLPRDFSSIYYLVIGGALFHPRINNKTKSVSSDCYRRNTQIDHFAISRKFLSCNLNVRNKGEANIGLGSDHQLMIAFLSVFRPPLFAGLVACDP